MGNKTVYLPDEFERMFEEMGGGSLSSIVQDAIAAEHARWSSVTSKKIEQFEKAIAPLADIAWTTLQEQREEAGDLDR